MKWRDILFLFFIFFVFRPSFSSTEEILPQLCIQVPRAIKPPVIDGIISPGEWDNAVSFPLGGWHYIDIRNVQFFILWDSDNVYVAQRTTLLPGESIKRIGREPKPDIANSGETEVELYIDAGTIGSNKMPCAYHVIANACGNFWDVEEQTSIGQHNVSWNGNWIYSQKVSDDHKYWTTEMAIPRETVYQHNPLVDGYIWKMGFGRDGGANPTGFFGFNAPVTFKDSCPIFNLSGVEKSIENKMAFTLLIKNPTGKKFEGTFLAKVEGGLKPVEERTISILPRKEIIISVDKPIGLKQGEKAPFFIEVRDKKNIIFRWEKPILNDELYTKNYYLQERTQKPFEFSVVFNPVRNFIRARVDRFEFKKKDEVMSCLFEVRKKGETSVITKGKVDTFRYDVGETIINLPDDLATGEYEVIANLLDKTGSPLGTTIEKFTKKDIKKEFPWFNNNIGISDRVLWPFLPIKTEGRRICLWNREVIINGLALPCSIVTSGRNILSSSIRITGVSEGHPFIVQPDTEPKIIKNTQTVSEFSGTGQGGPLKVTTFFHMDYDGCSRVELTFEPIKTENVKLESLAIEIPFFEEQATHMHTFRTDMRNSCYAGFVPKGKGRVWDSTKVPSNCMTVGSFVPLVYLGTPSGGLTWFADSDEGWWPTNAYPGIEIIREKNEVILRLNIAGEKVYLSGKRKIVFGLHISPVRPLDVNTWTPGTGICGLYEYDGRFDRTKQKRGFYMYPADPKKFNDFYTTKFGGKPMGIYTENCTTDVPAEDEEYFIDEWNGGRTKSLSDCCLYYAKKILEDCPIIHGFYIDNIYPRLTFNVEAGSAYILPDGRIQPGFDIWETRDYVRRLRTLLQDMKKDPHGIEVHMTCTMVIPVYSWADMMREGENPVQADNGRIDFADLYPPSFSAVMNNPHPWGIKSCHHWMFYMVEDLFNSIGPDAYWKAQRTGIGHLAIHDNLFPRPFGDEYMKLIREYEFAYQNTPGPDEFIPYWDDRGLFGTKTPEVLISIRKKPDRVCLWIMNYARKEQVVSVWCDLPHLFSMPGIFKQVRAFDIETMEEIPIHNNILNVKIPGRDFRLILIKLY